MKSRLIILSDIWGSKDLGWLETYYSHLSEVFEIQFYDVCKLAGIGGKDLREKERHKYFIEEGIKKAVNSLKILEKEEVDILGFSIGGVVGWKAALEGVKVGVFYGVSSTRLRYENVVPKCKVYLFYGEEDVYKPNEKWFLDKESKIKNYIFKGRGHELYKENEEISNICLTVKNNL